MVDGVDVPPQPGVDMQGAVHPVHSLYMAMDGMIFKGVTKGHEVVVGDEVEDPIRQSRVISGGLGEVARHQEVEGHLQQELGRGF